METMNVKIDRKLKNEILQELAVQETLALEPGLSETPVRKKGISTAELWNLRRKRRARRSSLRRML
ncbi:MAG TPA: hypothetical protein VNE41_00555 [Chitinophagaceae bacterium]|nr:hypothetical protein [Chitinophagaceae bacterium]